jgi:hypothetical protein
VTVDGHPALNLTSSDFLGLGNDPVVQVGTPTHLTACCLYIPHGLTMTQQCVQVSRCPHMPLNSTLAPQHL